MNQYSTLYTIFQKDGAYELCVVSPLTKKEYKSELTRLHQLAGTLERKIIYQFESKIDSFTSVDKTVKEANEKRYDKKTLKRKLLAISTK